MEEAFTVTCVYCPREATAEGVLVPKRGRMKGKEITLKVCSDHAPQPSATNEASHGYVIRRSAGKARSLLRPAWNANRSRGR